MEVLITVLAAIAIIPGSLLLLAAGVWKLLSLVLGFKNPGTVTLYDVHGAALHSEVNWPKWRAAVKARHPVRYVIFERLPVYLRGLGQRVKRAVRLRSFRQKLLFEAFGTFSDWVEVRWDLVHTDLPVVDEEDGLAARRNDRMAEIRVLYDWWTVGRPAHVIEIDEMPKDVREFSQIDLLQDDEHNLARLVNVWRDLT